MERFKGLNDHTISQGACQVSVDIPRKDNNMISWLGISLLGTNVLSRVKGIEKASNMVRDFLFTLRRVTIVILEKNNFGSPSLIQGGSLEKLGVGITNSEQINSRVTVACAYCVIQRLFVDTYQFF